MRSIIHRNKLDLFHAIKESKISLDLVKIRKALNFAIFAHSKQRRCSGLPYIIHPIQVAKILVLLKLDTESIVAALLHDIVEDTHFTLHHIEVYFGVVERNLVDGVTKLNQLGGRYNEFSAVENLRKLFLAVSLDMRILLIKLADRLHNVRTLCAIHDKKKQYRIANETLDIYVPLAERIGLQYLKNEMQNLCFEILYPEMKRVIVQKMNKLVKDSDAFLNKYCLEIQSLLLKYGIFARVSGRKKSPHSIWRKIHYKNMLFEELLDIIAFRVLVSDVRDCYKTLDILHSHYYNIPCSFQDYIYNPKYNGYQSLHTSILTCHSIIVEVQIRTYQMHEVAELGIAAHWFYKQYLSNSSYPIFDKYQVWMRNLYRLLANSEGFVGIMKDIYYEISCNRISCFTVSGDLVYLPRFSTIIDFAFHLGEQYGLYLSKANVNSEETCIRTEILDGQQIEVILHSEVQVSKKWLLYIKTIKAKLSIEKFLQQQEQSKALKLGKERVMKCLKRKGFKYDVEVLTQILPLLKIKSLDELMINVFKKNIGCRYLVRLFRKKLVGNLSVKKQKKCKFQMIDSL